MISFLRLLIDDTTMPLEAHLKKALRGVTAGIHGSITDLNPSVPFPDQRMDFADVQTCYDRQGNRTYLVSVWDARSDD